MYGENARVLDDNWNGMCKVVILTGDHKDEIKSYKPEHLRPEGHDVSAKDGAMRTATVMSNSFVELQVLKRKDWSRLIHKVTSFTALQSQPSLPNLSPAPAPKNHALA